MRQPSPNRDRFLSVAVTAGVIGVVAASSAIPPPVAATDPVLTELPPAPTSGGAPKGSGTPVEPQTTGRLVIRYADGVDEAEREQFRAANGLELAADVTLPQTEVVAEPAGGMQAMAALGERPEVEWIEPEQRMRLFAGPTTEPSFPQQWALHNTGQPVAGTAGVPDVDMNVPEAWGVTQGSPTLVVAVIDSGVDISHPDLAAQIWRNPGEVRNGIDDDGNGFIDDVNGWDFCERDNTVFEDAQSHGTHVAGSIAASGNGVGIAGVAPQVKIMPIRFLSENPAHDCGTSTQAAEAIAYAVREGARIVNASWGTYGVSSVLSSAIASVPGALVVAAAGNDDVDTDTSAVSPASLELPNILSVTAIHSAGHLWRFSNFGARTVDLVAPGEEILSTLPGNGYGRLSGTSMSAAHVSGVAALAASSRPGLLGNGAALRQHVIRTARAMPSVRGRVAFAGLADARAAVVARPDIIRLSGADRYATAAAISRATFVPGVPYVFVATGRSFPDALAGGPLAAQIGAPLLLVSTSSIPAPTLSEIRRLRPVHIYVLGGRSAVSDTVVNQLRALDSASSTGPFRLAGADRYATAAAISRSAFGAGVPTAFIAVGTNFPDALAGAPASAASRGPLLLVTSTTVPAATRTELGRLNPRRIVILGGTGAVSASVASQLDAFATGSVVRWSGANRYATAASIAAQAFPSAGSAFVTNAFGFADALAGGASAGAWHGPTLLVTASEVPAPTAQQLQRLRPARIFVLGGAAAVSEAAVNRIRALFP